MSLVLPVALFKHQGGHAREHEVAIEDRRLHRRESKTIGYSASCIDWVIAVDKDDQALKPFHILARNLHDANSFEAMDPPSLPIEMKKSARCELC
jgi:hypothetical protein